MTVQTMQVELAAATLNVVLAGPEDAPVITFSNSLMTDTRLWAAQMADLSAQFRVICYDQRGHGGSAVSQAGYGFDALAGDVVALWDRLGIAKSHFVGLSMGGMTALGMALNHADRLASCTLCSMRADAPQAFKDSWNERIELARGYGMHALAEPTVSRWFPPEFTDEPVREVVRDMVAQTPFEGFLGGVEAIRSLDYLDRVPRIAVPTLYLAGGSDGVLPAAMKDLAAQTHGGQYHCFENVGHLINLERPQEFTALVRDFVSSHPA